MVLAVSDRDRGGRCEAGFGLLPKDDKKAILEIMRNLVQECKKYNIAIGPLIGKLQQGKSIDINGKKIEPDDVSSIASGKKLAYITDTLLCDNCYKVAENADLLIC